LVNCENFKKRYNEKEREEILALGNFNINKNDQDKDITNKRKGK
jgi:hypothetical protein